MNNVIDVIKHRRSVRDFQSKQISDCDLEAMLECAVNAPSACNMQSWHFTVIQDPQLLEYLNETAKENLKKSDNDFFRNFGANCKDLIYGAPTLIIVSGHRDAVDPIIDCSAATQNMLLCAQSLGIGTLWNGFINQAFITPGAKEKAGIPKGYDTYFGVAVGYAKEDYKPFKKEIRREGIVNYIK